jgi:hypothetical protein
LKKKDEVLWENLVELEEINLENWNYLCFKNIQRMRDFIHEFMLDSDTKSYTLFQTSDELVFADWRAQIYMTAPRKTTKKGVRDLD